MKVPQQMYSLKSLKSVAECYFTPENFFNLCRLDYPIFIDVTSSLLIFGLSSGIFHFYSNCERTLCERTLETLVSSVASDLDLHCLYMSHKNDARLMG